VVQIPEMSPNAPSEGLCHKQAPLLSTRQERKGRLCPGHKISHPPQPWGSQPHRPSDRETFCAGTSKTHPKAVASQNQGVSTEQGQDLVISQAGRGRESLTVFYRGTHNVHAENRSSAAPLWANRLPSAGGKRPTVKVEFLLPKASTHHWLSHGQTGHLGCSAEKGEGRGSVLLASHMELVQASRAGAAGSSQEFRGVGRSMTMGGFTGW
jgi:hypothetical protein